MDFRSFWDTQSPAQKDTFASDIGHSRNYLDQIACGARRPSHKLARKMSAATRGIVPLHSLRPDIWDAVPTVASKRAAPAFST